MKSFLTRVLATLVLVIGLGSPLGAKDWSKVIERTSGAMGHLHSGADGKMQGSCSFSVVDSDRGIAVTAAHCVRHAEVVLELQGALDSDAESPFDLEVLLVSYPLDLALIQAEELVGAPALKIQEVPRLGKEVIIHGWPRDDLAFWRTANVVAHDYHESGRFVMDGTVIVGMSGGAVLDHKGRLVGVLVQGNTQLATAVAVPAVEVKGMLETV